MLPAKIRTFLGPRGQQRSKAAKPGGGRSPAPKIFCVGRNKTGTTSLKKAFQDLGFHVGVQLDAELLYDKHYHTRDFAPLIDYCHSAQVFQDVPFSCPFFHVALDQAFPGSKFILSVRDSAEQWYASITRFHAKLWGTDGKPPTALQLREATYRHKGFPYNVVRLHGTTDEAPYDKATFIAHYERHNASVIDYFRYRPDDLLVINLAEPGSYRRFTDFIGVDSPFQDFPWENKT